MKRRDLLLLAGASLLGWHAPPLRAAERKRIAMVTWRGSTAVDAGFRAYLARHDAPVELIVRDAASDPLRLQDIARELPGLRPDLLYTWGTSVTLGLLGRYDDPNPALMRIPAVFALVADAVGAGIVPRPIGQGRDVTGVSHVAPLVAQLEAMRSYRPFRRLGIIYNPLEKNSLSNIRDLRRQGSAQGFALLEQTFERGPDGKPSAAGIAAKIRTLRQQGAEWLYLGPDSFLFTQLHAVAEAAQEVALPTFASTESVIDAPEDILAGLVAHYREVGEFAAYKAMQILFEGRRAADIPVESLKRFSLVVRMDVARKMALPPPLEFYELAEMREKGGTS